MIYLNHGATFILDDLVFVFRYLPAKMLASVALLLPLLVASSRGFHITRVDPDVVTVKPGDSISLLCVVSAHIL